MNSNAVDTWAEAVNALYVAMLNIFVAIGIIGMLAVGMVISIVAVCSAIWMVDRMSRIELGHKPDLKGETK